MTLTLVYCHQNEIFTGNYRLFKINDHLDSYIFISIPGIYTFSLKLFEFIICPSIILFVNCVMRSLVLLHDPTYWFKFRNDMIRILTLRCNSWGGTSLKFRVCRNSWGYKTLSSSVVPSLS